MSFMNRREFIKTTAAVTAVASLGRNSALAAASKSMLVVVHGKDIPKMIAAGMGKMGGWDKFVKPGRKATIKPNVAWISKPEQGADTDPVLVAECVRACKAAGASEVLVPEKTCNDWKQCFASSGVLDAVTKAGGKMFALTTDDQFRKVEMPGGVALKSMQVAVDVLDTGCLINMPVAKHHSVATLTMSMKNWMGSVNERSSWHKNQLHQCIADCSTVIKPSLIIMDATRIMLTKGPRGPGEQAFPNEIIFGTDPVAVDAYGATLFKKEPFSIQYIKLAHDMGIGCGDLSKVDVVRVEV